MTTKQHRKHNFEASVIALRVKHWYPDAYVAVCDMLARRGWTWEFAFQRTHRLSWTRGPHADAREQIWRMLVVDYKVSSEEAGTLTDSNGGSIRTALRRMGYISTPQKMGWRRREAEVAA